MINYDSIIQCLPNSIEQIIIKEIKKQETFDTLEEIRLRINKPIILKIGNKEKIIQYILAREEINSILQRLCENSLYSYQEQIANGYITIKGGHRVGIVGKAVIKDDKVINLNYISGLNIRINRQIINCSNCIIENILNRNKNTIYNTLIVSPPRIRKDHIIKRHSKTNK